MIILLIIDVFAYCAVSFWLMKLLFGNKPLGRALAVITAIVVGVMFFNWAVSADSGNTPMWIIITLFLGPVILLVLGAFLGYVFGGKK